MSRLSYIQEKICSLDEAKQRVEQWKMKNDSIVFTNGCFDILHNGHVTYLAKAADFGTKLIVALNTDSSVKKLGKGEERPINSETARMMVIASLAVVDMVILFDEDTPYSLIEWLLPHVLVKGADYDPTVVDQNDKKYIVGSDIVRKNGGDVQVVSIEEGFSTTRIIQRLKNTH